MQCKLHFGVRDRPVALLLDDFVLAHEIIICSIRIVKRYRSGFCL